MKSFVQHLMKITMGCSIAMLPSLSANANTNEFLADPSSLSAHCIPLLKAQKTLVIKSKNDFGQMDIYEQEYNWLPGLCNEHERQLESRFNLATLNQKLIRISLDKSNPMKAFVIELNDTEKLKLDPNQISAVCESQAPFLDSLVVRSGGTPVYHTSTYQMGGCEEDLQKVRNVFAAAKIAKKQVLVQSGNKPVKDFAAEE